MGAECQTLDRKSLRDALGKHEHADGSACDCVGFANAMGGKVQLGLEDGPEEPPVAQKVACGSPDPLRKRLAQITDRTRIRVRTGSRGVPEVSRRT